MYYLDGRPKPGIRAFRFPFVAEPAPRGRRVLWGISPRAGALLVRAGRLGRFDVGAHGVFTRVLRVAPGTVLQARIGGLASVPWRVGAG